MLPTTDFQLTDEKVPTMVSKIEIKLLSEFVPDYEIDENGQSLPTDTFTNKISFNIMAVVLDQYGRLYEVHSSSDAGYLVSHGVITEAQISVILNFLNNIRTTIEGLLILE